MESKPHSPAPRFFATGAAWRAWLETHHARERELLVGFYKRGSGIASMTWPESVDAALCFGWIDGVRKRIDDLSYSIRFTPRKPRSIWSAINIGRVTELLSRGLVAPAGIAAWEARQEHRSRVYSFEQASIELAPSELTRFQSTEAAWAFFESRAPSYRRAATWWVINAKRAETRAKRLTTLIEVSGGCATLAQFTRRSVPKQF